MNTTHDAQGRIVFCIDLWLVHAHVILQHKVKTKNAQYPENDTTCACTVTYRFVCIFPDLLFVYLVADQPIPFMQSSHQLSSKHTAAALSSMLAAHAAP